MCVCVVVGGGGCCHVSDRVPSHGRSMMSFAAKKTPTQNTPIVAILLVLRTILPDRLLHAARPPATAAVTPISAIAT